MPLFKVPKLFKDPSRPDPVEAFIKAYVAMDVDGMLAPLADDVVFKSKVGSELLAEANNKEEFEAHARADVRAFKQRTQTIKKTFNMGPTTIVTFQRDSVVAKDMPNGWKAGQELQLRGATEFQLRDNTIVRITDQC